MHLKQKFKICEAKTNKLAIVDKSTIAVRDLILPLNK